MADLECFDVLGIGIGIGIFYFSDRKHTNRVNMIFDKIIRCLDQWMTV